MDDTYRVAVKDSVFQDTPFTEDDFPEDRVLMFGSRAEAEDRISARNQSVPCLGQLRLRSPHPGDDAGVNAYLVFRAADGLGDTVEDRQTEVAVGGYGLRSGTLLLDEATQDLLTFAYASGDYAVLVSHAATGDPKEIVTLPLETFGDYRASGRYHGIDVV
jgi:hypothetical protein